MDSQAESWPDPETLSDLDLTRHRDRAYLLFCACDKTDRPGCWRRVMDYKTELDKRSAHT